MTADAADMKTEVVFADALPNVKDAVAKVLGHFGGPAALLKKSRDVYIKVNAVDAKPFTYTDPSVLAETVKAFKAGGAKNVYVIENCTQGNFTRLVFAASGLLEACKLTGAIPVYLDETRKVPIFLNGLSNFADISAFVHQKLIRRRDENLYVSLPKLKTHSMSTVTLSIKNQFGFIHQESRIQDHNFRLHQKFADIYGVLRPDFVIVDGLYATTHGHYPATSNKDQCVIKCDTIFGGADPLSVDVAGAAFMGFSISEVPHLALSAEMGLGQGDLEKIEIVGKDIFEARKMKLTPELLDRFPEDVKIIRGKYRCCTEGCRRNTETLLEVIFSDHGGKGGFTIIMGSGISEDEIKDITGRVHVAGSCAVSEWGPALVERLGKSKVTQSPGCNQLALSIYGLCRQMGVHPLKLSSYPLASSMAALVKAKIKGSRALIPPLF